MLLTTRWAKDDFLLYFNPYCIFFVGRKSGKNDWTMKWGSNLWEWQRCASVTWNMGKKIYLLYSQYHLMYDQKLWNTITLIFFWGCHSSQLLLNICFLVSSCQKTSAQVRNVIHTSPIVHWQCDIKKCLVPGGSDQSKQHTGNNVLSAQFDIFLWFSYLSLKWQSM